MSDEESELTGNLRTRRAMNVALSIVVPPLLMLVMPALEGVVFPRLENNYEWQLPLSLLVGFVFFVREFRIAAILFCWAYFVVMYGVTIVTVLFLGGFFYHSQFHP